MAEQPTTEVVRDVAAHDFERDVVARSREVPVVVDFWAEWCGPCRQLGPALEQAVRDRGGDVELAKVDVDSNQALSRQFGIRGIPAVKAFRDGEVVAEFLGAQPPERVERFLDDLLGGAADDELASSEDEDELRAALEADPRNAVAGAALGRLLLKRGDAAEAERVLRGFAVDYVADGLAARAEMALAGDGPTQAFESWDAGDHAAALDALQSAVAAAEGERRDQLRRVMVAIFTELGADHPTSVEHRRRLAMSLN